MCAFVCDVTKDDIPSSIIHENSIDYATMLFIMSALSPGSRNAIFKLRS